MTPAYDLLIDVNTVNRAIMLAIAAAGNFPSVGSAGADSVFARNVWRKICGACPAMPSPGNVRTAEDRMDSATSENPTIWGGQNTHGLFMN